jgi:hypothetical protein
LRPDRVPLRIPEERRKCGTAYFRYERLTTEEHNTGSGLPRVRKNLREIQVVGQNYEPLLAGAVTDFAILGRIGAD